MKDKDNFKQQNNGTVENQFKSLFDWYRDLKNINKDWIENAKQQLQEMEVNLDQS